MAEPRRPGARWRAVSTSLRRPALVVAEVAALAGSLALAALLPQEPEAQEVSAFAARWPVLGRVTAALRLHAVVTSWWFLALVCLAALSLVAVQIEQWRRLRRVWSSRLEPSSFARAPYRRELPAAGRAPATALLRRTGRAGLLGSPVFHLGLLLVVGAGLVRLLVFRDAAARVIEGDVLPADASAWQAQRGGPLSRPFALAAPVRVEEVAPARYGSGALRQMTARLAPVGEGAGGAREVAINAPADLGGCSVYVLAGHGPAALLERVGAGEARPQIVYLEERGQDFRGRLLLEDGREVRFRTPVAAERPDAVEARLLRGPALLAVARMAPGSELALGGGEMLRLVALPWWAQLLGSRDPSRPFFFAGVAVAIAGIVLLFGFVPVDSAVFVERERLVVALRPQRFAPLFGERFEALCREWQA